MIVLQATQDIRKVSLWLGHSNLATTETYVRADPGEKLEAIEAVVPPLLRKGVPAAGQTDCPLESQTLMESQKGVWPLAARPFQPYSPQGTTPHKTGVVAGTLVVARVTLLEMTSQDRGAADFDVVH